ncbi:MAG TPA: lysophospholipid acyltransferase family protein [Thermoanaerobaculia bacterium]|nr:lysophospholipid acyltransferase family protein [Thermoanaerobaculia bacterium]
MPDPRGRIAGALRRLFIRVYFVFASLFGVSLFIGLSLLALFRLVVLKWERDRGTRRWLDRWSGTMMAVLGWSLNVEHAERLVAHRPAVLVGNHQSNLDAVVWAAFFPDSTVVIGKKQIGLIPIFGWLFLVTKNILIDRENAARARTSIAEAADRIRREGLRVWMAPEGHRNQGPEMLPFKKGAFHLAIAAQVPVVPFIVGPLAAVLDARRLLVRSGTITVKVLEPIPTAGMTENDLPALLSKTRAAMDAVRRELFAAAAAGFD